MLLDLKIRNFTIMDQVDITFEKGMSVLTGETGAGKSVLVDAIELALGERADVRFIRQGEDRCEISLYFEIQDNPAVKAWLSEHELNYEEECLIRRTLTQEGRSRCYINDHLVSLVRIKELAGLLLTIHGQHHNQLLFNKDHQRYQVDSYLSDGELVLRVKQRYQEWQNLLLMEQQLEEKRLAAESKIDFLTYQLTELNALQLEEGELKRLENKQKQLAQREQLLRDGDSALQKMIASEAEIFKAQGLLKGGETFTQSLANIGMLLENAHISIQEANRELESYLETLGSDTESLSFIEERLTDIYTLARKYRVSPEELPALHMKLTKELEDLTQIDTQKAELALKIEAGQQAYQEGANKLSQQRHIISEKMTQRVQAYLPELGMANAVFQIKLTPIEPSVYGCEHIAFWMSTNPGQPPQPLEKVLSGGELSRLNLAIQAVFVKEQKTPVLIFDEIDTGMSGAAAEQVGRLMRFLSEKTQVISITHLPQVAINAQHHYVVQKETRQGQTYTQLEKLSTDKRPLEIARMLGGLKITAQTLAHAKELLDV